MLQAILYYCFWITNTYPSRDPNFAGRELLRFGSQVVGILQTFYSRAVIQRTIVDSPAFLELGLAEKIAVCVHTSGSGNRSESWEWLVELSA